MNRTPPPTATSPWALVLAGGSGLRLSRWTTDRDGTPVPKQFCVFAGRTLLAAALERAGTLALRKRTLAVVTAEQRRFWGPDLAPVLPDVNIAIQPCNRGTAAGILFPLLRILRRDPAAALLILPSDHFVHDEARLAAELGRAIALARQDGGRILLLGVAPDRVEDGLGWITPRGKGDVERIQAFVEKPAADQARAALAAGALVNSFLIAADGRTLLDLFRRTVPELVAELDAMETGASPIAGYERLPVYDFSRDVIEPSVDDARLMVLRIPSCGWSDLGTPERLQAASGQLAEAGRRPAAFCGARERPDLGTLFTRPARTPEPRRILPPAGRIEVSLAH